MRRQRAAALTSLALALRAALHEVHSHGTGARDDSKALRVDDDSNMVDWINGFVDRAVQDGRQTPEAAAYFRDMLGDKPEFADCLREAKRLTGGQDPTKFTPYQQGLFADRLGHYVSGVAAQKLMQVQQEEQQGKNFTKDGTPTGEQYWYEAGTTLSSPAVPNYVKDDILLDMQRARRPDSPAFEEPEEVQRMAETDEDFAAHVRRQKRRLFSGADFGATEK